MVSPQSNKHLGFINPGLTLAGSGKVQDGADPWNACVTWRRGELDGMVEATKGESTRQNVDVGQKCRAVDSQKERRLVEHREMRFLYVFIIKFQ